MQHIGFEGAERNGSSLQREDRFEMLAASILKGGSALIGPDPFKRFQSDSHFACIGVHAY